MSSAIKFKGKNKAFRIWLDLLQFMNKNEPLVDHINSFWSVNTESRIGGVVD